MHITGTKSSLQNLLLMKHKKNVKFASKTTVTSHKVRKGGKDLESIKSSTTPDTGFHMVK